MVRKGITEMKCSTLVKLIAFDDSLSSIVCIYSGKIGFPPPPQKKSIYRSRSQSVALFQQTRM